MIKYVGRQIMNALLMNLTPIIAASGGVLAILIFVILFFVFRKKGNKPQEEVKQIDDKQWLIALGDKENIKDVTVRGSRLSVELYDDKKINREELTTLGVKSIITMSNKLILVIEQNASLIADKIKSYLQ